MKSRTRDILNCLLSFEDIELLKENGFNPYKYKLVEKNAEIKIFQVFDESENPISLRW